MTPEYLSSLAGILLSLLASYLPGFSPWLDNLDPNLKRPFTFPFIENALTIAFVVQLGGKEAT